MGKEFEAQIKKLHEKYGSLSDEERKELREYLKRKNIFAFRKMERMKHDLLRLESRRAQLKMEGNEKELAELDQKVLKRKEEFLKKLSEIKKKRG